VSVAAVATGLATNLDAIPETQVLAAPISNPTPPTIWVAKITTEYDRAMGRRTTGASYTDEYTATIQGFVNLNEDIANTTSLYNYLSSSGVYSVKAAIEADRRLGGACDDCWVNAAEMLGLSTFLTLPLLLAEWTVTIIATEVAL
jgi:hypothetical protein